MAKLKENAHFKIVTIRGETLEEAMKNYGRKKAFEFLKKIRDKDRK